MAVRFDPPPFVLLLALALATVPASAMAEDPHANCRALASRATQPARPGQEASQPDEASASASATPGAGQVEVRLVDAPLVDQDGQPRRLASDVVGDRLVVLSFVFTTCTTICPIISSRLTQLQERLGDRLGGEVRMVSISIDPRRDTPARLKAYAQRHQAGPGWLHLTGEPDDVEQALRGLGVASTTPAAHAPVTLVADGRTGTWTRLNGFPSLDLIVAQLDALAQARTRLAAGVAR
jgi:protein SCO1/2